MISSKCFLIQEKINAVGSPRVVINGTCLDYLAESFMAGNSLEGGGIVILNGLKFNEKGKAAESETPYPGGNLFSLASGGAIYLRDPFFKVDEGQLNGGRFAEMTKRDWDLILPYLKENERLLRHFAPRKDTTLNTFILVKSAIEFGTL